MRSRWPLLLAIAAFALDQGTKAWAVRNLVLGEPRPLLGNLFRLTRVHNPGGALGLFPQHTEVFIAVAAIAVVALSAILALGRWRGMAGLGGAFLLGGAAGNLVDRVRWGYVLDFFDVLGFPVFNVADATIVIGAGLLSLALLWRGKAQ